MSLILDDRRLRWTAVPIAPELELRVLEVDDPDGQLESALRDADADPYAAVLWPAAVAAAAELASGVGPGLTVVDAGAGIGLVALAAARLGARSIALDHDRFALRLIDRAAAEQALDVETRLVDLGGTSPLPAADIVVFADLLYDPDLARTVALRAAEAVQQGARVLVADPNRVGRGVFARTLAVLGLGANFRTVLVKVPGEAVPSAVDIAWIERPRAANRRATAA